MAESPENPRAIAGGNLPPLREILADQLTQLPELLARETEELEKRVADLLAAEGRMNIASIDDGDEETAAKVIAFQGQVQKCISSAESRREELTDAPLAAQRLIMGHVRERIFAKLGEPKSDKKTGQRGGLYDRIGNILTDYERRKVAIERRKRDEEEKRAREAAQAAERARLEVERIAREAAEAERKRQAEAEAAIKSETDLQAAIEREAQEKIEQQRRAEASRIATQEAERRANEAAVAAQAVDAKASTLSRTAGLYGSSSGLRESWKGRIVDHAKLKADAVAMGALWEFIKPEAIEDALNRYAKIKKNTSPLTGCEFFDASRAQVRA